MDSKQESKPKLGMLSVFKSIMAAGFGVQKDANLEKDFQQGTAKQFIIAGAVGTILFLLVVWGVVQWVLASAN